MKMRSLLMASPHQGASLVKDSLGGLAASPRQGASLVITP